MDAFFSQNLGLLYQNKDYDSLKLALKELAATLVNVHRENPEFFQENGSQLLEFAKKIAKSGVQWLETNRHLIGKVAVILVSSCAAFQIYRLYNFGKTELKWQERTLHSLCENELKPILEYINNKLLSDLENVDPDDFCDAAGHVVKMLDKLAARLTELITSNKEQYQKYVLYALCGILFGGLFGAVVSLKWGVAQTVLSAFVLLLLHFWLTPRVEKFVDETMRAHGMLARSRTQIQLSMVEIKRTGKEKKAESGEESSEEETK